MNDSDEKNGILQRLRLLREKMGMTQEQFGELMYLARSSYSSIEQGHNPLTERHVRLLCEQFGVERDWLMLGKEPMFREREEAMESCEPDMKYLKKELERLRDDVETYKKVIKKLLE
jgi:transcriptional regulator with XRE-family HTH domain